MIGKVWQAGCVLLFLGEAGRSAALDALRHAPAPIWALSLAYVGAGQALNLAMYTSIGDVGVYYGFKLGARVPWCSSFPFNIGLRHPQYVGVVLTLWGALALLLTPAAERAMLPQVLLVWGGMYALMAAMEQLGDAGAASKQT
mmetsp:Transcript_31964/g.55937  ORF Transcript_31964/g.55937 Transcript_31964/m.55937 type:complete len:143 (+) Transcript_31964:3-431(+)